MNRRSFLLLIGAAAGASALSTPLLALPANGDEHGEGHGHGNDGDHGNHDNGKGHGNGHNRGEDNNGEGRGHEKKYQQGYEKPRYHPNQRYFRDEDDQRLVQYYDGPRELPPGLRRKYYRNGTLPPGWQARFRPMPVALIQQLPPVPYGYERGYYDGYAVVLNPRTRILYDVVDVLGALRGR